KPPDTRFPPSFQVQFRRPVALCSLLRPPDPDAPPFPDLYVACVKIKRSQGGALRLDFAFGLDLRFDQGWNLIRAGIGDLSSTMALAPGEQLTVEFQSSQRRVLDRSSLDMFRSEE